MGPVLYAQGMSLQLKKVCQKLNPNCEFMINNSFLECPSICEKISTNLFEFLQQKLVDYVKNNLDSEGEYPICPKSTEQAALK